MIFISTESLLELAEFCLLRIQDLFLYPGYLFAFQQFALGIRSQDLSEDFLLLLVFQLEETELLQDWQHNRHLLQVLTQLIQELSAYADEESAEISREDARAWKLR